MSEKMIAFLFVMPTCLRGYLPHVYEALCDVVLGLRILDGAVHSENVCATLHIETGSHCLKKTDIQVAEKYIVQGLSKLEGSLTVRLHVFE